MPFTKNFFENMSKLLSDYLKVFPCGTVTVTLRAYESEYSIHRLLEADDYVLTFAYYDDAKSVPLPERATFPRAYPSLSLPYEVIRSVEFNPAKPASSKEAMGFRPDPMH